MSFYDIYHMSLSDSAEVECKITFLIWRFSQDLEAIRPLDLIMQSIDEYCDVLRNDTLVEEFSLS